MRGYHFFNTQHDAEIFRRNANRLGWSAFTPFATAGTLRSEGAWCVIVD